VIKPVLNVLVAEQVRRAVVMLGQGVDETDVTVNRALGLAVERQILDELLA
jgi:hypothetical protein